MASFDAWFWIWVVEVACCCILAAWKGGSTERIGAAIILVGWLLSELLESHKGKGPGPGVVIVDLAGLVAIGILSAKTRRLWTLFAFACQLNGVAAHFAELFTRFGLFSYITDLGIWSGDGLVICVIAGIVDHRRRKKRIARMTAAGMVLPPIGRR